FLLGAATPRQTQPDLGFSCFPADNPWNWDITGLSAHPSSDAYVNSIGSAAPIREDYSFYYSVVLDAQPNVNITLGTYAGEHEPSAHGTAPEAEGEQGHLRVHGRGKDDPGRPQETRPDRRR